MKYLGRLGLFALVSEIPFDLAFEGRIGFGHQNIMLSFFLAVAALMLYERIQGGRDRKATGLSFIPLALYNGKKGKGLKCQFSRFSQYFIIFSTKVNKELPVAFFSVFCYNRRACPSLVLNESFGQADSSFVPSCR